MIYITNSPLGSKKIVLQELTKNLFAFRQRASEQGQIPLNQCRKYDFW